MIVRFSTGYELWFHNLVLKTSISPLIRDLSLSVSASDPMFPFSSVTVLKPVNNWFSSLLITPARLLTASGDLLNFFGIKITSIFWLINKKGVRNALLPPVHSDQCIRNKLLLLRGSNSFLQSSSIILLRDLLLVDHIAPCLSYFDKFFSFFCLFSL
jgi:hypothetical protein